MRNLTDYKPLANVSGVPETPPGQKWPELE